VDINFSVDLDDFEEWRQAGLPPSTVKALHMMEQGLDKKANLAVLGLLRDFSAM
jgi:hypothetical protein